MNPFQYTRSSAPAGAIQAAGKGTAGAFAGRRDQPDRPDEDGRHPDGTTGGYRSPALEVRGEDSKGIAPDRRTGDQQRWWRIIRWYFTITRSFQWRSTPEPLPSCEIWRRWEAI